MQAIELRSEIFVFAGVRKEGNDSLAPRGFQDTIIGINRERVTDQESWERFIARGEKDE